MQTSTAELTPLDYEPDIGPEHMVGFLVVRSYSATEQRGDPVSVVCWAGELANPESDPLILIDLGSDVNADPLTRASNRFVFWRDAIWRSPAWPALHALANPIVNPFSQFVIPLMKRAYPALIADQLVSVQPMSRPAGLLFYQRCKYAGNKTAGTAPESTVPAV